MEYTYPYPRPAYTVDALVFDPLSNQLLLIQRGAEPFKGLWALPGGFVDMDETPEAAARRELAEETGLVIDDLQQMHTFGAVDRDPRHRTISTVYCSILPDISLAKVEGQDDAVVAAWFAIDNLPELAFDHSDIIAFFKKNEL